MKLTETQLRSIVKQELKKILNEMSPNSGEWAKTANKAYVDSSIAWRYSHEYQPKEGIDFSDTYQEYLNKIVYPRNNTLPDNDKVPPSLKEFIDFCLSKGYMTKK